MTTEQSIFDKWLTNGRYDPDKFRHAQVNDAIAHYLGLAEVNLNLVPSAEIQTNHDLVAWLADVSNVYGELGKRFTNGRRQIVYFASYYVVTLSDKDERRELLKEMPNMFGYVLGKGDKKKASKAWSVILADVNTFGILARDVGTGKLPQAIFSHVRQASKWIAMRYAKPAHNVNRVKKWFVEYYAQHGNFGLEQINATTLEKLYLSEHGSLVSDRHNDLASNRKADDILESKAKRVLSGTLPWSDCDEKVHGAVVDMLHDMGIQTVIRKELIVVNKVLGNDYDATRADSLDVLTNALDNVTKAQTRIKGMLAIAQARVDTGTDSMPIVQFKRADVLGKLKLNANDMATLTFRKSKTASVVEYYDADNTDMGDKPMIATAPIAKRVQNEIAKLVGLPARTQVFKVELI